MGENGHSGGGGKLGVLLAIYDFPMVNIGLRTVIDAETDMHVIGEADSRESMLGQLEHAKVDLVITECLLQREGGRTSIEAIEAIRASGHGAKVLVLACQNSSEHFSLALKAGADGFLTREAQPVDIASAIRCIGRGHWDDQAEKLFSRHQMKQAWYNKSELLNHVSSRMELNYAPGKSERP